MGRSKSSAVAARWRACIGRWRRSGLSIAEFCRREQISQPSFFAWRKRFSGERAKPARRRDGQGARGVARFVEVSPAWPPSGEVRILLPGGARVTLPVDASPELLSAAIRAAMSPSAAEAQPC